MSSGIGQSTATSSRSGPPPQQHHDFSAAHDAIERQLQASKTGPQPPQQPQRSSERPTAAAAGRPYGNAGGFAPQPPSNTMRRGGRTGARLEDPYPHQQQPAAPMFQPQSYGQPMYGAQLYTAAYPFHQQQQQQHLQASQFSVAAAAASHPSAVPGPLPYHRKRLLELVDPQTYDDVLRDTAKQLGVDLHREPGKRWIVEALFLAPLPQHVVRCYDAQGHAYYHDKQLGVSSWKHPCAEQFEALLAKQPKEEERKTKEQAMQQKNQQQQEAKTNDAPSTASDSNTKSSSKHTRRFLRANRGVSSTSSLFLQESELAAWGEESGDEETDADGSEDGEGEGGRQAPDPIDRDLSGEWLDDEFGGRDGERWIGENGTELQQQYEFTGGVREDESPSPPRQPSTGDLRQQGRRSRAVSALSRGRSTRPSSSTHSHPRGPSPPPSHSASGHPAPWSSAQPVQYHPWVNPTGVGNTDHRVRDQGSLIADSRASRPVSAMKFNVRPLSAIHTTGGAGGNVSLATVGTGAGNTNASVKAREAHSMAVSQGHKLTRMRINGQLRSTSSHLYTIRQTLLTKLTSLERIRERILREDERVWLGMLRALDHVQRATEIRRQMFQQAVSMLYAQDAAALEDALEKTRLELAASAERIRGYLRECQGLGGRVDLLQQALQRQIDQVAEVLRVDAACLELSKTGQLPPDMQLPTSSSSGSSSAAPPPSTSLLVIQTLLNDVLDFQSVTRTYHATVSTRKAKEKALREHLVKMNALLLRRGGQHCSERKATVLSELLANKSLIPSLHNQAKSLKTSLAAQMGPLEVCQKTYALRSSGRVGGVGGKHSNHRLAGHGGMMNEQTELLRALEDELSALTTLVAHLESELSLTQAHLASCLEQDQLKRAELSAEDVRMRFYRSMLGVSGEEQPGGRQQQQWAAQQHQRAVEEHEAELDAGDHTSAHYLSHAHTHGHSHQVQSPTRATSAGPSRLTSPRKQSSPSHAPPPIRLPVDAYTHSHGQHGHGHGHRERQEEEENPQYRKDSTRAGTHGESYANDRAPSPLSPQRSVQLSPASAPAQPLQHPPAPYSSAPLGGSGRAALHRHLGGSHHARPLSASDEAFARHERNQLVRDQASNQERLRTRKVRRAKVAAGAADREDLQIPNAGRPVFEGVHSTGYDS